ncbi:transposase [Acinetobacter sp.]|uniref:transposase n=1 Tax=Acinetobacter sp. TaxID=472 RepID=UPI0035B2EF74
MKRNRYDESFKSEAVSLALSGELSYAEVARDLGINYGTLTKWIYSVMNEPKPPQAKMKKSGKPSKPDYQALERQLKAAHKELELRKKEIDVLKKAAAYFASMK